MSELYLLGFKAEISALSNELFVYDIAGRTVLEVRSLLNRRSIPNVVRRVEGKLCVVTLSECKDLREPMRVESTVDSHTLASLANSAIRLKLRREGWTTSYPKIFNPEMYEDLLGGGDVRRYNAYRVAVHYHDDLKCHIVSVDPSFKLETSVTLNELSDSVLASIHTVKICGERYSFELLGIEEGSGEAVEYAQRTVEILRSKLRLQISGAEEKVAKVYPRSRQLREFLSKYNLLLKETKGRGAWSYAYLPTDALCPVPSFENLRALGVDLSKKPMWKTPNKRYEEAKEFAKSIEAVKISGLEVKLLDAEPTLINAQEKLMPLAQTQGGKAVRLDDVVDRGAWGSRIIPIRRGSEIRGALINKHPGVDEDAVETLRWYLEGMLKGITGGQASIEIVQGFDQIEGANFNAVIYIGPGDPRLYAEIEYRVAGQGLIPQYIDGDKLCERMHGKRKIRIENYAFPIAKGLAFRAGWRYLSLTPPPELEDAVIAGVDRTYVRVGNGMGLGVVPVLTSPDGLDVSYLDPIVGGGEEEIAVEAARKLREQLDKSNANTLVLLVNRANVPRELEEVLEREFDRYVCVGVARDHSYPRLLRKEPGVNVYVNPAVGDYCVISEKDTTGAYLVSASDLRKSQDRTIKPLLVRCIIRGLGVRPRDVLRYVLSMNTLNIEGAYFPASLPWPLHRADRLCKKLYSLALYTRRIPPGKVLELL
ncbi:MAG: hypothetical protein LM590_12485 [Thermofilum sp.]|nr:hypothetical protein [Thermofilum sp.]